MELQNIATPQGQTPHLRYASLHRAVERGIASEDVWKELGDICLQLGHVDEAISVWRRMPEGTARQAFGNQLRRRRALGPDTRGQTRPGSATGQHKSPTGTLCPPAPKPHSPRLAEHCLDAGEFLLQQHMPWIVLLTMAVFPLVVGLGGFLTAGGSPILLAGIAAVPGFGALAVVGAMGRRVLIESSNGSVEVPQVPDVFGLVREAARFGADLALVVGSLLAPSLVLLWRGAPLLPLLPGLLLGAFVLPMAWGLRQIRGDFGSVSPRTLLRAIHRCGSDYVNLNGAFWAMFVPAMLAAWLVNGRAAWLQISVLGPLLVLPVLAASRLLGTWFDVQRVALGVLLARSPAATASATTTAPAARPPVAAAPAPQLPARPSALAHFDHTPAPRKPAARPAAPPARPTSAKPKAKTAAAAKPAAPAPAPAVRQIEGRGPARPAAKPQFQGPDLRSMPGAVTVTGTDRERSGAAARRQ